MYHDAFRRSPLSDAGYSIEEVPDQTRFQGIGAATEVAIRGERWPVELLGQVGCMDTSVIPGRAPLLVAAPALASCAIGQQRQRLCWISCRWWRTRRRLLTGWSSWWHR